MQAVIGETQYVHNDETGILEFALQEQAWLDDYDRSFYPLSMDYFRDYETVDATQEELCRQGVDGKEPELGEAELAQLDEKAKHVELKRLHSMGAFESISELESKECGARVLLTKFVLTWRGKVWTVCLASQSLFCGEGVRLV